MIDQCDLTAAVPPGFGQHGLLMDIICLSVDHNMSTCRLLPGSVCRTRGGGGGGGTHLFFSSITPNNQAGEEGVAGK